MWPSVRSEFFAAIPLVMGLYLAVSYADVNVGLGETGRAAVTLLTEGRIANPYAIPTGPTAHVSPIQCGYLAAVFWAFGVNTPAARIALAAVCAALWAFCAVCVMRGVKLLRLGQAAMGLGVVLACLTPPYLYDAVVNYRQWDQPFAAAILMYSMVRALERRRGLSAAAGNAALAGVGGLISPTCLPSLLVAVLLSLPPLKRSLVAVLSPLVAGAILASLLAPWGLRNAQELGAIILTRSNFGLELAVGNNDLARGDSASANGNHVHPFDSREAAEKLNSVGELSYMNTMKQQAMDWIASNPSRFIDLTVRRIRLLLFPDRSMVGFVPLVGADIMWAVFLALGLFKIAALAAVLSWGESKVLWLAYTALPLAPYAFTHVNMRYEFAVYFPTVLLIAAGSDQFLTKLSIRSSSLFRIPSQE